MVAEAEFHPRAQPAEFYIPSLRDLRMPPARPVPVTRFVATAQAVFSSNNDSPQRLDFRALGDLSERLHVLAIGDNPDLWTFDRFAPRYKALLGCDLTGSSVSDTRFWPYNTSMLDQLRSLVAQRAPFYAETRIEALSGDGTSHRIFIPMSRTGRDVTHCLLFSFNHNVA